MAFDRILIVDDEPAIGRTITRLLEGLCKDMRVAHDRAAAHAALEQGVDLVITDVRLGEDTQGGIEVARAAAALRPPPVIVAMSGAALPADGVALGRAGVSAFLPKPFTREELLEVFEGLSAPTNVELDLVVRRIVGDWAMPDVLDAVRRTMVFEALARTQGNKAQAAQLLGISRQNLQNILTRGRV